MKNFTTKTTKNDKVITISIMVDNETAKMLEQLDEQTRHEYILAEHELDLLERRETRRHQSLDLSLENGHEFVSEEPTPDEKCIEEETYKALYKAISALSEDQQWLVKEVYFKGRPQVEIAKELGILKTSLNDRLTRALKKLKKFLY